MMRPIDLARRLLIVAQRDMRAFQLLAADPSVSDEPVGFHAQQVVEKCLKAVLAARRIEIRKIHDLAMLVDIFAQNQLPAPPNKDELEDLSPYAVMLRYDFVEDAVLDRKHAAKIVEEVYSWAVNQLKNS